MSVYVVSHFGLRNAKGHICSKFIQYVRCTQTVLTALWFDGSFPELQLCCSKTHIGSNGYKSKSPPPTPKCTLAKKVAPIIPNQIINAAQALMLIITSKYALL